MILCRLICPEWLITDKPGTRKVLEGKFSRKDIKKYNELGYNIFYRPNYPSTYEGGSVNGTHIDTFEWVFCDYDCKSNIYESKDEFLEMIASVEGLTPTRIVDSGNGIHTYWKVSDLDAKSFLRLGRRLMRLFNTDDAVQTIPQLMRLPGTINTKKKDNPVQCETLFEDETIIYTCEELNELLPNITPEDETYCTQHYNKTYNIDRLNIEIDDKLPAKFGTLLRKSPEVKEIWSGSTSDRSKDDYRLGHIMFANGFTKEEAASVLVNSAKALSRAPIHRVNYATNIIDKIWIFEETPENIELCPTVKSILAKGDEVLKGIRFPCHPILDDTVHGFRLGQVIGIIGGSGVGKTTLTLNTFLWFAENNPEYHHFFFSLEQPPGEIAARIRTICQGEERLFDKIHIISNYSEDGTFKNLSLDDIENQVLDFTKLTNKKIGAVVVDHIGVLAKSDRNGESEGLISVCKRMKSVAVNTNSMLMMLSQAPREKAGIGDLELNKDAAFGTVFFESFVDYCLCLWQPLKRAYDQGAPTIMAFKFAKIRHKRQGHDRIKEDVCYQIFFDPKTERLRELTEDEEKTTKFFQIITVNMRKRDRKTDLIPYKSRRVNET